MKVFAIRDESIVGDMMVSYVVHRDTEYTNEDFQTICERHYSKGLSVDVLKKKLIEHEGFEEFTVADSFIFSDDTIEDALHEVYSEWYKEDEQQ